MAKSIIVPTMVIISIVFLSLIVNVNSSYKSKSGMDKQNEFDYQKDPKKGKEGAFLVQNVIDFYNQTVTLLDMLEELLLHEPYDHLDSEVFGHIIRMEGVNGRLEGYLESMREAGALIDTDSEFLNFMKSIENDIDVLNDDPVSKNVELIQASITQKMGEEKAQVSKMVRHLEKSTPAFEKSVERLETEFGIWLRPHPLQVQDENQPPFEEKFDLASLVKVAKGFNNTMKGLSSGNISQSDIIKLSNFMPIVILLRKKIERLIPETNEIHERMGQELMLRGFNAHGVSQKMVELIKEVKTVRRHLGKHQEL